jgi:uncharacterized protein (TIGR02996 family)
MTGPPPAPRLLSMLEDARQHPEDDGPRLVLADYLEDHGEAEPAEFMRLQVANTTDRERLAWLLSRYGGGWLGPLWRHGGTWHRGLLSVTLDRLRMPEGLDEVMPWVDTLHLEVPGRDALRWALSLLPGRNHATLLLRRPFTPASLIESFRGAPPCECLRTLTVRWPPGMGRRTR